MDDIFGSLKNDVDSGAKRIDEPDMYGLWHVLMDKYGYIPYDDFMNKMSCQETLQLLSKIKLEADILSKMRPKNLPRMR